MEVWVISLQSETDVLLTRIWTPTPKGEGQRGVRTMFRPLFTSVTLLVSLPALATSISCPEAVALAGTYRTSVPAGYTPNEIAISVGERSGEYKASVSSYWEPKPFDKGEHGTVGNFSGELYVPKPWSCVAILEIKEKDVAVDTDPIACGLVFRFLGRSVVYVEGIGACEYFHGDRAYPYGKYIRQK